MTVNCWQPSGASEHGNEQLFLSEFCTLLDVTLLFLRPPPGVKDLLETLAALGSVVPSDTWRRRRTGRPRRTPLRG